MAEAGDARLKPLTLDFARVGDDILMNISEPPTVISRPRVASTEIRPDHRTQEAYHTLRLPTK
jgi:hypothetical protein